jgi:molybdenum cofactor cytidylyltransferase
VLTSTTRLFKSQIALAPAALGLSAQHLLGERLARFGCCLVVGDPAGDKVLGVPADWPGRWLAREDVDLVVVEADGSRRRPVKAPAGHEPVLPAGVTLVIAVMGIDALQAPLAAVAHRPERVAQLTGLDLDQTLTPAAAARLLADEQGGLQRVPPTARFAVCLNKVETAAQRSLAQETASRLLSWPRVERVVITALQRRLQGVVVTRRRRGRLA